MRETVLVQSKTIENKILSSCHSLIAAFFPGKKVKTNSISVQTNPITINDDYTIKFTIELRYEVESVFEFKIYASDNKRVVYAEDIPLNCSLTSFPIPGKESLFHIQLKQAIISFLAKYTGQAVPWGILTGLRPSKLIHRMDQLGIAETDQTKILKELYLVRNDKTELLQYIGKVQRSYLQYLESRENLAALYISIPFCPTRCYYCSFPSYNPIDSLVEQYLSVIGEEIKLVGQIQKETGLTVNAIYIGGGTPTILGSEKLDKLLQTIREYIPMEPGPEYTVEAGRPDTIDKEKLIALKKNKVNRISINPQSMHNSTLQRIGRKHTVTDIYNSYKLARENGDWDINMDLILGLPEEGFGEIRYTLEKILELCPDNITVHSLAQKRGSSAWMENYNPGEVNYWLDIQKKVHKSIDKQGFVPYYLYRQKYIVGNMENIGYTLPGRECIYNIAVIEEKQNVFGVGAGASSKIINVKEKNHKNIYHSVNLDHYMRTYKDINSKIRHALEE